MEENQNNQLSSDIERDRIEIAGLQRKVQDMVARSEEENRREDLKRLRQQIDRTSESQTGF